MIRNVTMVLVLAGCSSESALEIREATCTEIAELAAAACERRTSTRCDQRFESYHAACESESRRGRSVCIDDPRTGGGRRCVPPSRSVAIGVHERNVEIWG